MSNICKQHNQPYKYLCLSKDCTALCPAACQLCLQSQHKHFYSELIQISVFQKSFNELRFISQSEKLEVFRRKQLASAIDKYMVSLQSSLQRTFSEMTSKLSQYIQNFQYFADPTLDHSVSQCILSLKKNHLEELRTEPFQQLHSLMKPGKLQLKVEETLYPDFLRLINENFRELQQRLQNCFSIPIFQNIQTLRNTGLHPLRTALSEEIAIHSKAPTDSTLTQTFINRAASLEAQGKLQQALQVYNQAIADYSCSDKLFISKALLLRRLGRLEEARKNLQIAVSLNPQSPVPLTNLANTLKIQGKKDLALVFYDKALALQPANTNALYNKAACLAEMRRLEEALELVKTLKRQSSIDVDVLMLQGTIYSMQRKYVKAVRCYDIALEIQPDNDQVIFNKALALDKLNQFAEALKFAQKASSLRPEDKEYRLLIDRLKTTAARTRESGLWLI